MAQINEKAVAAFTAKKAEIDTLLARLVQFSGAHFGVAPEDVSWGHVGDLDHYASLLRRVSDSAFREGEHAPGA
jgi:hypothetical protein